MKHQESKQPLMYGIIGLLVGLLIMALYASSAVNSHNTAMMRSVGMHIDDTAHSSNESSQSDNDDAGHMMDMSGLEVLEGEAFDKAFLAEMIDHHNGAVDMAKLAFSKAQHQEIKDMSANILETQSKEVQTMIQWQKAWGFKPEDAMDMMHGAH